MNNNENTIYFDTTADDVPEPHRTHDDDAGTDLTFYDLKHGGENHKLDKVTIVPGGTAVIGTGVIAAIPPGHVGNLYVRSSLGVKKQITLANGTGIIDTGYRGEIMAVLQNNSPRLQTIKRGERIVQLVVTPANTTQWQYNPEHVAEPTERGTGAYGSTGD